LKNRKVVFSGVPREVSNPWREAIEGGSRLRKKSGKEVSNPWREAILFSPLGEYGFSREGFAFVLLTYFEYLVLFSPLGEYGFAGRDLPLCF